MRQLGDRLLKWSLVTSAVFGATVPLSAQQNPAAPAQATQPPAAAQPADPVLFWAPSINPGNIAFYTSDKLPGWRGDLLMAAMSRSLVRIDFDDAGKVASQERLLTDLGERLRDVRQGPDGLVYVLTDETAGALLRIEP